MLLTNNYTDNKQICCMETVLGLNLHLTSVTAIWTTGRLLLLAEMWRWKYTEWLCIECVIRDVAPAYLLLCKQNILISRIVISQHQIVVTNATIISPSGCGDFSPREKYVKRNVPYCLDFESVGLWLDIYCQSAVFQLLDNSLSSTFIFRV